MFFTIKKLFRIIKYSKINNLFKIFTLILLNSLFEVISIGILIPFIALILNLSSLMNLNYKLKNLIFSTINFYIKSMRKNLFYY